eukprot:XP_001702888.1 predicted protein [Chlamydomonas reinhardtii]
MATKSASMQAAAQQPLRVLITGASEGIGAAVARRFAQAATSGDGAGGGGVRLALLSRSREKLEALVEQLGGLDVVVHNGAPGDVDVNDMLNVASWRGQMDMHVLSGVAIAAAAQPALAASRRGGVLLCVSSICGQMPIPGFAAYCAAKAAQDMLVRTLAVAWGGAGIRVLSVAPGPIHTPGLERYVEPLGAKAAGTTNRDTAVAEGLKILGSRQPLGRVGTPEEVAAVIFFLATQGSFVTGTILPIDGGALAYSSWAGSSSSGGSSSSQKTGSSTDRGVEAPAGAVE